MLHEPELRTLSAQPVAYMCRTTTPEGVSAALGEVLPGVWTYLAGAGTAPAGPPFARYLLSTDRTVEFEAGLPVAEPVEPGADVQAGTLPGGEVLVVRHLGAYDTVFTAHAAADRWREAHGRAAAGPAWEMYLTDPEAEPDPDRWVTDVYVPLAPS